MDQGVIRNLKCHYRKQVIQRQLRAVDTETDIRINVLDAIHMMENVWRLVTATTIANCYRHAGFVTDIVDVQTTDSDDPDDDIPLAVLGRLANGVTFDHLATADEHLPVCADLSDNDIVDNLLSQRRPDTQCDDGDDVEPHRRPPVNIDVLNGLDRARDYIDQYGLGNVTYATSVQLGDITNAFNRHYLRARHTDNSRRLLHI